tara:strand:+ start:1258 stop:1392 length:135 start_codon:yes stop_codon:yes gene_type:complete
MVKTSPRIISPHSDRVGIGSTIGVVQDMPKQEQVEMLNPPEVAA